ncbi:MAG: TIGR03663 family protein [Kouleothrix sp.]|nr:TIGR03663 family protein [Kouleothrix sp.]
MSAIPRESRDYAAPRLLERRLDLSWINLEVIAFGLLMMLSVLAHLWALDVKAMHHDESIHAWSSWRLYTAAGAFNCAGGRVAASYCYDPVYHGPALYHLTALSYFLFGDGEWQARLPMALAGILLTGSAWMLRPYFGARGTFTAAALLAFSPSLLYFTRFARHDALMLLWVFWIVLGFFRYLDSGRPRYLYLLAAGTALAMATHELYYILFFLFGAFVLVRLLDELLPRRSVVLGLAVALALALVGMALNPPITTNLRAGGLALLLGMVVGVGLLMVRVWDPAPLVSQRLLALWRDERRVLWTALAILGAIFALEFSNFFTDPRGILDGLYQGLAYWLGSQHEYARGKQPWYYYLMLMPVYEPVALLGAIGGAAALFARGYERLLAPIACVVAALIIFAAGLLSSLGLVLGLGLVGLAVYLIVSGWWRGPAGWRRAPRRTLAAPALAPLEGTPADAETNGAALDEDLAPDGERLAAETIALTEEPIAAEAPAAAEEARPPRAYAALFPLFLAFWFIGALVAFSWAGEKMPWLVTHIALPGNLLVAWAIGRLLDSIEWRALPDRRAALIPFALTLTLVALGVALWRLSSASEGQAGQANLLQAIVPLLIAGLLIFGLLTIGQHIGARATLAICALTIFGILGAYTIRATWMVVYDHPDTPIELLIYVQSTPDVPLIVDDIRTLAINQTRNTRTAADPTGGHSMPVIMDIGDDTGEGSLAWPYQWYFRDFQRIEGRKADFFRTATADSFEVAVDSRQPDGDKEFAPVVMVYVPHMTEETRQALEENYVKRYDSKLNWYFPEGDLSGCDPRVAGYKRFYYNSSTIERAKEDPQCKQLDFASLQYEGVFAPLIWPFRTENWATVKNYLLYRQLPSPLRIDGREMQVWVRKDLAASGGGQAEAPSSSVFKLVAQQVIGSAGHDQGQLDQPRGVAVDRQGNVYVADLGNSRVEVFGADGKPLRTIGAFGGGDGQFNEPRDVAVDQQGNLYVADTWNARVQKFDPSGKFLKSWGTGDDIGSGRRATMTSGDAAANAANPLGLFGPRAVAVDDQGRVYIADTGNKRIVVTDGEGNFLYQWGHGGNEPGAFNEPIGVAVDQQGSVYVADTWNGRVQVFVRGADGKVGPTPQSSWRVQGWQPNTYDDPYIAASADGRIYASVPGRNLMLQASPAGDVLLRWGGKGDDTASLTLPSGAAVGPDGAVYVVDRGNGRVLKFELPAAGR